MRKIFSLSLVASLLLVSIAKAEDRQQQPKQTVEETTAQPFVPFTGRITRNKVRLRLKPHLDAYIIQEVTHGDLFSIVGEDDDFYAVSPPEGTKAYIFRTFVLDGVVEGNRVNIRLEPNITAPIVSQANTGDRILGEVSEADNKWIEFPMPESVHFYVSKNFVESIGPPEVLKVAKERQQRAESILNSAYSASESELQKTFDQIDLNPVFEDFEKVIHDYRDFPGYVEKAKHILNKIQTAYLEKKIAYLEEKTHHTSETWQSTEETNKPDPQEEQLTKLEEQLEQAVVANEKKGKKSSVDFEEKSWIKEDHPLSVTKTMAEWLSVEKTQYERWKQKHGNKSMDAFYQMQKQNSVSLNGVIEPYSQAVKNRPGNYLLVSKTNKLPIAYLYSTTVDLQDYIGKEVIVSLAPRPNNYFAFPAYFALDVKSVITQ